MRDGDVQTLEPTRINTDQMIICPMEKRAALSEATMTVSLYI